MKNYLEQAENKHNGVHYVLFSAHDTTILAVMSALGVPLNEQPHYASDLKFLLFRDNQGKDFVEVFYNAKPVSLSICQNRSECPLEKFLQS